MFCKNCGKPEPKRNQAAMVFALPDLCLDCSQLSSRVHRRYDTATGKPLENKSNICEQCGGQKTVYIKVEPVYSNGFVSAVRAVATSSTMKICTCPVPKEKHDGKLDKVGKVRVWFDSEVPFDDGSVHLGNDWGGGISLMASEALSLLAWLKQEQDTLERLAQG